ncbi:MAG: Flp pilus assembly complex ATPase component TadA [Burkholderiales bacterium]|nr:Flp pilus assembly complex ATPase component TadA [Burkholderiales bacterium]
MDRPTAAVFNPQRFRLGDVLIGKGLLDAGQLARALELQKTSGRKLGRVLTELKFVSDLQIAEVVADQLGIEFVDLTRCEPDPAVVRRLSEAQARRFRALVLGPKDGGLEVGLVDAADMVSFDQLSRVLKATIHPVVVTEEALLASIERIYQRKEELAGLASQVAADVGDVLTLSGLESAASADDAPIVKLLNSIFGSAVTRNVSDIHIEPQERALQIRFRADGVMQVQSNPDARIAGAVVQRLKLMASLDISEKRLPQDGRFRIKVANAMLDVRISTLPTQFGESVVMRLLAQNADRLRLDALDIPAPILKRLRAALTASSGMVLVTGPTGSGKTTTLYAALSELNKPDTKIITVEDPVEYRLPGLNQVQVNEKVDLTFSRVLRACLRQDPDVILVGEMRDAETAEIGLRAALTGHLVLSTLHTTSAAGTPMRLRDMGVAPYMVALGVRLVIAQRLVRTICRHCRSETEAAAHEREWLADDPEFTSGRLQVWRGTGCTACHGSGYSGRVAVYEMLEMTPELMHLVNADDPAGFAAAAQRAFAEFTLRRAVLQLVHDGHTTLAEAMRVGSGV